MEGRDTQGIKTLVTQIEEHIYQDEISIKKRLIVSQDSSDSVLDDIFLSQNFDEKVLTQHFKILRSVPLNQLSTQMHVDSLTALENRCLTEAAIRLKAYIDAQNEHIIKIVESESDEFLSVAHKLEGFKDILGDLKDSVRDYYTGFKSQKQQTVEVFSWVQSECLKVEEMEREREQLERLIKSQEMLEDITGKMQAIKAAEEVEESQDMKYLEIEEVARDFQELWQSQEIDSQVKHHLINIQRDVNTLIDESFYAFLATSDLFKVQKSQDEDQQYLDETQLASFLRSYQLLERKDVLYCNLKEKVVQVQLQSILKRAFDSKNNSILYLKGDSRTQLPLQIFLSDLQRQILEGTLGSLLKITLLDIESFNFTTGYDPLNEFLWPLILQIMDNQLSFVYSTANPSLFQKNFLIAKSFKSYLEQTYNLPSLGDELMSKFNLATFYNSLVIENTDKFNQELEKNYELSSDQIKPLHPITMSYSLRVLNDELYLSELGDRLIKLSVQFIIRHLTFVMDKINERRGMATERVLFILEDLNALWKGIQDNLAPLLALRLSVVSDGGLSIQSQIQDAFVNSLLQELRLRFEHLSSPCISTISTKITQRILENMQAFKQVPTMYRMTNRSIDKKPSQFLSNTLSPLQNLSEQKVFANLSSEIKYKLYSRVLLGGLKDLHKLIEELVAEERKMHESLRKYKKMVEGEAATGVQNLSDFNKTLLQFYIDIKELERQIMSLYQEDKTDSVKEIQDALDQIYLSLSVGEQNYKNYFL